MKPTFFSKPRASTGSIFKFSETANCALAPAPLDVMLVLYATNNSTSFWKMYSRLSSNLCESERSTALLAQKVVIAIWSAEAYSSDKLVVVGRASEMTRIRRSPK